MSKICAPVRDDQIKKLAGMTDVVAIFRGIMEVSYFKTVETDSDCKKSVLIFWITVADFGAHDVRHGQFLNRCHKTRHCCGKRGIREKTFQASTRDTAR